MSIRRTDINHAISVGKAVGFLAAIVFVIASSGWAQARSGGGAAHAAGHVVGGRPISHSAVGIVTPLNPNFTPIRGLSGNEFNHQHMVAVGGRRGGIRDRRPFITPLLGFGLPYYYAFDTGYPYDYGVPSDQAPAAALVPSIPDTGESPYAESQAPEAESEAAAPPIEAPLPPPELGQLILVRRDGQVVMAVAFTTSGGRLTYITKDGLRRSFPVTELDADATRQMNSVNGTSVALPD